MPKNTSRVHAFSHSPRNDLGRQYYCPARVLPARRHNKAEHQLTKHQTGEKQLNWKKRARSVGGQVWRDEVKGWE